MKYRLNLVVLALIMTAFVVNDATAQRGGFGRSGGRGQNSAMMERMRAVNTFPVARVWHVLSIQMETADEQVLKLRAVVKEATAQKEALVEQAEKSEDWDWLREQLEESQKRFEKNLQSLLSPDEMKTFSKLSEEASQMRSGGFGRFRR